MSNVIATMSDPRVVMPTPHLLQREIALSSAKRKVVCAGRRFGKTIMAARMAVGGDEYNGFTHGLLDSKRVLISSTSQDQSDIFWDYITDWLVPLFNHPAFYKNEVKRIVRVGQGEIHVKTGHNPDALRGGGVDLLILDECAYLDANAWAKVGAPMLADTDGDAVFISTPKRRNWFFELFTHAQAPENTGWQAWHATTLQNPFLKPEALQRLMQDMTREDYQQEILAEFLEGQGAVFRHIDECATLQPKAPYPGQFVFGVDWAMTNDSTVIIVLDKQTRQMVVYDRFNGIDWALQRGRLMTLYQQWRPEVIIAEENSIGSPNIEALQREGLPVKPFMTTAASKPPLIESLVLAFERGEIVILNDTVLKGELMAFERKVGATGRSQYSAPEGMHDDMVIALALAWSACTAPVFQMEWI